MFGSARKSYIQMLDPIQNQSLRLCLDAFRTTPVESLQVEANEPPLAARRSKLALQYAVTVYSNPPNPVSDSTINPQYQQTVERKPTAIPTFGIRVEQLLLNTDIDLDCIAAYSMTTIPPWTIQLPTINFSLHNGNKSSVDPNTFKVKFYDVLDTYTDYTHIYTDGSKDGDRIACPGVCGQRVMKCRLPDCTSIFSAESQAIMLTLDFIEISRNTTSLLHFPTRCLVCKQWTMPSWRILWSRVHTREMPLSTVYSKNDCILVGTKSCRDQGQWKSRCCC